MVAFHGKPEIKEKYLTRVRQHRVAFGYWRKDADGEFRGCALGCILHSSNHEAYESELGIPKILARLEDGIFEKLPAERAQSWPEEFLQAAGVGADLSLIWPKFAIWLMMDEQWGVINFAKTKKVKQAIKTVSALYERIVAGKMVSKKEFDADAAAAAYAATATYAAAYAAAYAATAAAATYAAYAATAAYAADADAAAAAAAAAYAATATAADAAADAADAAAAFKKKHSETRLAARLAQANKLLELMSAATVHVAA